MREKNTAKENETGTLDAIREIVVGPEFDALQQEVLRLSQQVDRLIKANEAYRRSQEESLRMLREQLAIGLQKQRLRASRHRKVTKARVVKLASKFDSLTAQLEREAEGREAWVQSMSSFAEELRAVAGALEPTKKRKTAKKKRKGKKKDK